MGVVWCCMSMQLCKCLKRLARVCASTWCPVHHLRFSTPSSPFPSLLSSFILLSPQVSFLQDMMAAPLAQWTAAETVAAVSSPQVFSRHKLPPLHTRVCCSCVCSSVCVHVCVHVCVFTCHVCVLMCVYVLFVGGHLYHCVCVHVCDTFSDNKVMCVYVFMCFFVFLFICSCFCSCVRVFVHVCD